MDERQKEKEERKMAKAVAVCTCWTCGKTFKKEKICQNRQDAESFESWAADNITECPECWGKRKTEEREAKKNEMTNEMERVGMAALDGTEKQIKWAANIRLKFYDQAKKLCNQEAVSWCLQNLNSAKWWIENRDDVVKKAALLFVAANEKQKEGR